LNLLVVSQYFWPENFRINDLVRSLVKQDVHVDVLTGQPNYPDGKVFPGYTATGLGAQDWHGATVHRVPLMPRGRGSALGLIGNYLSFVVSGILLAPFALRRKRVDVIFVYAISPILQVIPAIFLKWIKGAKLVIWVQDLWPESLEATGFVRNRKLLKLVEILVRWIYRHADLILVQSEAFVAPVAALAEHGKISYYPNSADNVFFQDTQHQQPSAVAGLRDGFSIVFAGNLGTAQSVETIIAAAALLQNQPHIRLVLVGNGSRADWLSAEIARLKLQNVIMAGQHPLDAMPAILRQAGALLVSLRDEPIFRQTVPSKLQAYLAMGRPIIACLNGEGARIVTQAQAGIACAADNAPALAAAILEMSRLGEAEREQLGQNGLTYFKQHFDSAMLTQNLITHFDNLLTGNKDNK
jgi:glycosyltransferase involved in cell wall biosynthesis